MSESKGVLAVDIIVVNWNAGNLLLNCIQSIIESSPGIKKNVIIVDNNSKDGSLELVEDISTNIQIVKASENLGFGKACNLGSKKGNSPYILFINPDTEVFQETISESLEFIANRNDVGILGVKHVDENGYTRKSCSRFITLKNCINSISGISILFPRIFKPASIMTDWNHEKSQKVDQVMGAYMLIRRKDFELIEGFDERFFVYYEDMDLAKRILTINKISYYNSNIEIYHKGEGTTDSVPITRLVYVTTSKFQYARKHWKISSYFVLVIFTLVFEPITRSIFLFIKGKLSYIPGIFKGYFMIFFKLLKIYK